MTEVWKSTGRKFCEICKVWFGDNKASLEFHERGLKHQAAVKQKLRDLGKSNEKKAREAADLNATLAAMEHAAHESMKSNNEGIAQGPMLPERGIAIGPRAPVGGTKYLDPRQMSMQSMAAEMERRREEEKKKKEAAKVETKSSLWRDDEPENDTPIPQLDPASILWVEADSEDGRRYYYHMYSGATSWEIPDRFFTQREYDRRLADLEKAALDRHKQGLPADPSQTTILNKKGEEISAGPAIQVAKRKHARDDAVIEAELKSSRFDVAPAPSIQHGPPPGFPQATYRDSNTATGSSFPPPPQGTGFAAMPERSGGSGGLPPAEDPNKPRFTSMPERSGPSFTSNRKERREARSKYGDRDDAIPLPGEIPLPPSEDAAVGGATSFTESRGGGYRCGPVATPAYDYKEEIPAEEPVRGRGSGAVPFPKKKKEEFKAEEEEVEEDGKEVDIAETVNKLSANAQPFGSWSRVKEEPLKQAYVAPVNESEKKAIEKNRAWKAREMAEDAAFKAAQAAKPPDERIEFTEKVAPVLTKKKNAAPVEFKKRSAPRSVRKRDDD